MRPSTEGVARLFRHWRGHPERVAEAEAVYSAYGGGDMVDVGAYHGWYAALLAPKARPGDTFVLVEPDSRALPFVFHTVQALTRSFPDLQFAVVTRPAGDGSALWRAFPYGEAGHPRFDSVGEAGDGASVTVDGLVRGLGLRPTLLKVDVEGAEAFVVRGARATLAEAAPVVMLETHPLWQPEGVSVDEAAEPLRTLGYTAELVVDSDAAARTLWRRS